MDVKWMLGRRVWLAKRSRLEEGRENGLRMEGRKWYWVREGERGKIYEREEWKE